MLCKYSTSLQIILSSLFAYSLFRDVATMNSVFFLTLKKQVLFISYFFLQSSTPGH
jgi:hypothetical protein